MRVPQLIDVPEEYTVKVAQLQDETFTYTVNVPHAVTEKKVKTVVNAVPVTKTRTIQVCVPSTTMQSVTKDYGHWEDQVVEVPAAPLQRLAYGLRLLPAPVACSAGAPGSVRFVQSACAPSRGNTACGGCSVVSAGCGGGCGSSVAVGAGSTAAGAGSMAAGAGCGTIDGHQESLGAQRCHRNGPCHDQLNERASRQLHRLRTTSDFGSLRMHHGRVSSGSANGNEEDRRVCRRSTHSHA